MISKFTTICALIIASTIATSCSFGIDDTIPPYSNVDHVDLPEEGKWEYKQLDTIGISILLPLESIVNTTPLNSRKYDEGARYSIYSHSSGRFKEINDTGEIDDFFSASIYEMKPWSEELPNLKNEFCYGNGSINRTFKNEAEDYNLIEIGSCAHTTLFLITKGSNAIRIEAGQDTRNMDNIWRASTNIIFE